MGDYKPIALVLMLIIIAFKGTRGTCNMDSDCMNGGTCNVNTCDCSAALGYTGLLCNEVDCSAANTCMNGGTCNDDGNACLCEAGFTGELCGTDIDECASGPCMANEDCTNGVNMYTCACSNGFSGNPCTVDCSAANTCMNGGTCNDDGNACLCEAGFTGELCGTDIDECASGPCMANEDCTDGVNMYTCACSYRFSGNPCTATTPATRMLGTLQCYSCSTNSISDVCSTADELASGSGVSTVTCYEGERCWTDHYENSSHTVVSRRCTDDQCNTYHEGGGPYCTSANGVISCTSCCTASKCNDNKSSSEGLTSSCVTWLTSLFSVIMIITYI